MPSPLPSETIDVREDRFRDLVEHYARYGTTDTMSLAGRDGEGRFAFVARTRGGGTVFARVSSLARAEVAAVDALTKGWTPECAFDLDYLTEIDLDVLPDGDGDTGCWPMRYDIAGTRTIVIFNTMPTPVERWA